jgi:hypothetical protein
MLASHTFSLLKGPGVLVSGSDLLSEQDNSFLATDDGYRVAVYTILPSQLSRRGTTSLYHWP